jgi:hypothetical protein
LTLVNEVKAEDGAWTVTNRMTTPMGVATDTFVLDRDTLVVRKRSIHQGPVAVELAFQDNKATGSMKMNGQDKLIAADLGGPVFSEAAAAPSVFACLPLADGYTTTFRNFDVQKQKEQLMQLKVSGSETVKLPAGSFDAFKAEISSDDGSGGKMTLWIARDSRKPLKFSATLPEMGGAIMTAELSE